MSHITKTASLIIWRLSDGKAGHQNQTLGLVNAMKKKANCQIFDININHPLDALASILTSHWPLGKNLPAPDLIIGAGHATHLHLLAAQKSYGGKTIVLMKPSLPVPFFDLCMIPLHDDYKGWGNVIETRGVLNPIVRSNVTRDQQRSLIMLGGPSKHYEWHDQWVLHQLKELLTLNPEMQYTLTTSRRTPAGFLKMLSQINLPNIAVVPFDQTDANWVASQLNQVSSAWITEDSVSMVYESLTANVGVGLLNLHSKGESRVAKGIKTLVDKGYVTKFDGTLDCQNRLKSVSHFSEADRCSELVFKYLLQPQQTKQAAFSLNLV